MKLLNKPPNQWNTDGMYSEWREKCPLGAAGEYLWKKLQQFPQDKDWRKPEPKSPEHIYYLQGWEFIHQLQDALFSCSSISFNRPYHWPFLDIACEWPGCAELAECILNQVRTAKKDEHGDDIFVWLPDAPQFHCSPHHYEACYGERYIPPTEEQIKLSAAQFKAQEFLMAYDVGKVKGTPENFHFVVMDKNYLQRMVKLIEFFLENPDGQPPLSMITDEALQ